MTDLSSTPVSETATASCDGVTSCPLIAPPPQLPPECTAHVHSIDEKKSGVSDGPAADLPES
jgi:hypothetical protein